MNALLISKYLEEKIDSVNDLRYHDFQSYKRKYNFKYTNLLDRFTFCERITLTSKNLLLNKFFGIKALYKKGIQFVHTRIKSGNNYIMIPLELEIEMNMILSKSLDKYGLFGRSAPLKEVDKCIKYLKEDLHDIDNRQHILTELKNYDIITHIVVFKSLFKSYSYVFPKKTIPIILKTEIVDNYQDKLILTKIIILALPDTNRSILDSVCKFFNCIYNIVLNQKIIYKENKDIQRYATVMLPVFFQLDKLNISDLIKLISWFKFVLSNFKEIFEVEDI